MCLLLLAVDTHPRYALVLAANRDEYFDRPTADAAFWPEAPHVVAGKDRRAGGTWLGVTRGGRIAAITNYRDPASLKSDAPSRGHLVSRFLLGEDAPMAYLENLSAEGPRYNGFNVVVGDGDGLYWYSNRSGEILRLTAGVHGLSNRLLDTPWPKVVRGRRLLQDILSSGDELDPEAFLELLLDRTSPGDESLPETGVGLEWERILSPIFIASAVYGTRSSTVLIQDRQGRVTFVERSFSQDGQPPRTAAYQFQIEP